MVNGLRRRESTRNKSAQYNRSLRTCIILLHLGNERHFDLSQTARGIEKKNGEKEKYGGREGGGEGERRRLEGERRREGQANRSRGGETQRDAKLAQHGTIRHSVL